MRESEPTHPHHRRCVSIKGHLNIRISFCLQLKESPPPLNIPIPTLARVVGVLGRDHPKSIDLRRQMLFANSSSIHFILVCIVLPFMIDLGTNPLIYVGMTLLTVCVAQWKQHDVWTRWSMRMHAFGNRLSARGRLAA